VSSTTQVESGKRTVSLTAFAVTTVVLVIISGILGFYVYTLASQYNSLKARYDELLGEYSALESSYEALHSNYTSLSSDCSALKDEHNILLNRYNILYPLYKELHSDYISPVFEYIPLQAQYDALLANYTALSNNYDSLKQKYENLSNSYSTLQSAYNELQAIVNLNESKVLAEDKPVQLPANSYVYLEYDLSYAGYLRITFSATGDVYLYVGNGDYWVRYPSDYSKTATSGSFIVPVLPGTTYIYIYNPSLLSGRSVTITVEYTY